MMHRRTDLWGPDGTLISRNFDGILTYIVSQRRNSTPTASSMLASRVSLQEPVHLLTIQRRPAYLPRAAGTVPDVPLALHARS